MAVTTTPRSIIEAAYAKSLKNKAGTIATEGTELLQLVIRIFRSLYAGAARINPLFFSESPSVAFAGSGWARPEGAQLIYRLEAGNGSGFAVGTEVIVVPFDQRNAEPGKPAVYRLGQVYRPASGSATVAPISPQAGSLTFFYSKRPTTPATLDTTVDPLWIEDFNEIPILRVARFLAMKDGRAEEVGAIESELNDWVTQFIAFLEHETVGEIRNYGHVWRFNAPSLIPVVSLLSGTSKVST